MRRIGLKAKILATALTLSMTVAPFAYAYNTYESQLKKPISAPVSNKDYQSTIDKAKETKKEYEKKAQEAQAQINALNSEYNNITEYMRQLDEKQNVLFGQVAAISTKIEELNADKEATEKLLAEMEVKKAEQYKTMSARIKYVYENGETSYLDILLHSGNIASLLNRVEYVSKIAEYDDKLFKEYASTVSEVKDHKEMLAIQMDAIDEVERTYKSYMDYAEELAAAKEKALDETAAKLGTSKELYKTYMREIESQQMTIAQAEEALRKQILAAQQAAQQQQQQQSNAHVPSTGASSVAGVTQTENSSAATFIWPLPGNGTSHISSGFGIRKSPTSGASSNHKGIDIWCKYGTPIVAAGAGQVVRASYGSDTGNCVMILHKDGSYTVYMHCSAMAVSSGAHVKQGQVIAYAGSTGISTGVHLHFGVIIGGTYVNPLNYVRY